jgi:hypothetical protein
LTADAGAAVALATAVAYAILLTVAPVPAAAAGALAFVTAFNGLRSVRPRRYVLADFGPIPLEAEEPDELILTEADRFLPQLVLAEADRVPGELILTDADRLTSEGELVLEDVLAEPAADSRVVRLFDPAAMPTPGQLHDRIDRHLSGSGLPAASPDASQALHQALADLRRSLR